jgi:flagellar basal body-associated protein FliL
MNKKIIIAIIIVIILGLAVAGLGWFNVMQKKTPALQKSATQIPAPVIEERPLTAQEKTKYGIAQDVQAKIKITTSQNNKDEQITTIELSK